MLAPCTAYSSYINTTRMPGIPGDVDPVYSVARMPGIRSDIDPLCTAV